MADKEEVTGFPMPRQYKRAMKMGDGYDEMYKGGRTPTADEKLRAENPGLQELWDQYQTMLKLCKPAEQIQKEDAGEILAQIRTRNKALHTPGVHIEADMYAPCDEVAVSTKSDLTLADIRRRLMEGNNK